MPNGISKNEEMMKKDWTIKKLGELCRIRTGKLDANAASPNGKYPFFTCSITPLKIDSFSFDCECVLVAGNGDLNVKYYEGKFDAYQRTYIIESLDKSLLDVKYLYLFLSSYIDTLRKQAIGAIIKYIKLGNLTDANLPLPSLEEQKRIVAVLDKKFAQIETLKTAAEKNLQNTKQLFQAELEKAFSNTSWEKKRLDEVCAITSKLVDPTQPEYLDLYHVGGANIESETGIIIDLKTSKEEGLSSGKFTFDESMVLYNKIRPYLKKVARPDFSGLCSADMYPLNPKGNITKDYLYYILISDNFTEYAISKSGRAGMPKVNREALFAYECYLPPLEEQKRIVAHLDFLSEKVHQLEEIYTKQLADCDELKQAFLQKAFEGEL